MDYCEKINIYVSKETGSILDRDNELFEIYKPDKVQYYAQIRKKEDIVSRLW